MAAPTLGNRLAKRPGDTRCSRPRQWCGCRVSRPEAMRIQLSETMRSHSWTDPAAASTAWPSAEIVASRSLMHLCRPTNAGYRWELTDFRVLLTLSRSVLRDLTVPRCALMVFFSRLSDFLCRFTALRRVSSRRSTVRNTFCAAATLEAGGVADRLPRAPRSAVAVLALRDRVLGRVLVDFFLLGVAAEGVRREVRFLVLLLRADVADLVAMSLSFYRTSLLAPRLETGPDSDLPADQRTLAVSPRRSYFTVAQNGHWCVSSKLLMTWLPSGCSDISLPAGQSGWPSTLGEPEATNAAQ